VAGLQIVEGQAIISWPSVRPSEGAQSLRLVLIQSPNRAPVEAGPHFAALMAKTRQDRLKILELQSL
jgi:hypothetical protein